MMTRQRAYGFAVALILGLVVGATAATKKKAAVKTIDSSVKNVFYIYSDKGARVNHYIPSGWMGDYGDLKIDDGNTTDPADGKTCVKITYTGKATQGANWAGIFW